MRLFYVLNWVFWVSVFFADCGESGQEVPQYGMYEISFQAEDESSIFQFPEVSFYSPDGRTFKTDGFYDGGNKYLARAYCNEPGLWKWKVHPNGDFKESQGSFRVVESDRKGKLRKHPEDPYQFAYDNGEWYLHIGDTGYRYLSKGEPKWKEYIDQARRVGMTKIRAWFNSSRFGVEELFSEDHTSLNLSYWQEIDKRIAYAYENYPDLILQLIPFGEDTEELKRYLDGDSATYEMVRYAQARFSAYPNIFWCISNDREILNDTVELEGRQISKQIIEKIGQDMAAREPWGTLLTNHQSRYKGYDFVDAPWSDIITLEDVDEVDGRLIAEYRAKGSDPVVLDEDRYELYIKPDYPRYFFRRLMWSSLLSGGHATYGGIHTYVPHETDSLTDFPKEEWGLFGVQGYFDAGMVGANDFQYISQFFNESGLTLVGMKPNDALVGNKPQIAKCTANDSVYIAYLANPDKTRPASAQRNKDDVIRTGNVNDNTPTITITLAEGLFSYDWYNPRTGDWEVSGETSGGDIELEAPEVGDWVLLLRKI